jgi:predicted nuclease of predicted toxin-antitoxin system
LRRRGIDVSTTVELGLISASDEQHLDHALREGCVLITQDRDFLQLNAAGAKHAGIAFFRQGTPPGEILRMISLLHDLLTDEEMTGRVEFL